MLILSSKDEACGIDLSFVSDIIIFEPILGNYVKDIEKQIVGRILGDHFSRLITILINILSLMKQQTS